MERSGLQRQKVTEKNNDQVVTKPRVVMDVSREM